MHMHINLDKMANCKDKSGENTGEKNRWNRPTEDCCTSKARIQRRRSKIQFKIIKIEKHLEKLNLFIERD